MGQGKKQKQKVTKTQGRICQNCHQTSRNRLHKKLASSIKQKCDKLARHSSVRNKAVQTKNSFQSVQWIKSKVNNSELFHNECNGRAHSEVWKQWESWGQINADNIVGWKAKEEDFWGDFEGGWRESKGRWNEWDLKRKREVREKQGAFRIEQNCKKRDVSFNGCVRGRIWVRVVRGGHYRSEHGKEPIL